MKRILCYGDSNTWGYDPVATGPDGSAAVRFPEDIRWTGVLQQMLGPEYRILEEGLNGRTTVFDDPAAYGRSGDQFLEVAIRSGSPFDCMILMLGTNDLKDFFGASAQMIAYGMAKLIRTCRAVLPYTSSAQAKIVVAAPLNVCADANGEYQYDFSPLSPPKGQTLRQTYRELAEQTGCAFFDVNDYVQACAADGVHLDADGHRKLGEALAGYLRELLKN